MQLQNISLNKKATQYVTVLISLDLSAAFDTVDHEVLLQRLKSEFGVTDTPLFWLRSYLESHTQFVKLGQHQSSTVGLDVGFPQGSVLGPLLFAVSCSPETNVIMSHGVQFHQYADDTQLHLAMSSDNTSNYLSALVACTAEVKTMVPTKRAAAQHGQVGSTRHWHC